MQSVWTYIPGYQGYQPIAAVGSAVAELMATAGGLNSFIQWRLIHLFEATMHIKEDWTPTTGEQLLLRREPGSPKDHSCSFSHKKMVKL